MGCLCPGSHLGELVSVHRVPMTAICKEHSRWETTRWVGTCWPSGGPEVRQEVVWHSRRARHTHHPLRSRNCPSTPNQQACISRVRSSACPRPSLSSPLPLAGSPSPHMLSKGPHAHPNLLEVMLPGPHVLPAPASLNIVANSPLDPHTASQVQCRCDCEPVLGQVLANAVPSLGSTLSRRLLAPRTVDHCPIYSLISVPDATLSCFPRHPASRLLSVHGPYRDFCPALRGSRCPQSPRLCLRTPSPPSLQVPSVRCCF